MALRAGRVLHRGCRRAYVDTQPCKHVYKSMHMCGQKYLRTSAERKKTDRMEAIVSVAVGALVG